MSDISMEPAAQESERSTCFPFMKSHSNKAATVSLQLEQMRQYQARLRVSEAKWQEVRGVFIPFTKHQD